MATSSTTIKTKNIKILNNFFIFPIRKTYIEDGLNGNDPATPNRELLKNIENLTIDADKPDSIAGFYEDAVILVTGGTGN